MPNMANITVKKFDGVTDVIYTALTPSSGDGTAARWRVDTGYAHAAAKPSLSLVSRFNGPKSARRIELEYGMPFTSLDTTTGLTAVVATVPVKLSVVVPLSVPDAVVNEAVAQACNLVNSPLIRSCFTSGYAAS